mmetsp:Transcript_8799/g.22630  ORF Transcript_8799/g.22630 Transcript_8799/m.22630 type:complete len:217 (-) Transcript_8799:125-775(-)
MSADSMAAPAASTLPTVAGSMRSSFCWSLWKRLVMRPLGVASSQDIGARSTRQSAALWTRTAARMLAATSTRLRAYMMPTAPRLAPAYRASGPKEPLPGCPALLLREDVHIASVVSPSTCAAWLASSKAAKVDTQPRPSWRRYSVQMPAATAPSSRSSAIVIPAWLAAAGGGASLAAGFPASASAPTASPSPISEGDGVTSGVTATELWLATSLAV